MPSRAVRRWKTAGLSGLSEERFVGCRWKFWAEASEGFVMKILALEFSSPQRSVALVQKANSAEMVMEHEVVETGNRSSKPFEMIEEVLRQSGTEREQVERLAIGLGPGSYNGIRGSIALAQGWQLGAEIPVQGMSSAECV